MIDPELVGRKAFRHPAVVEYHRWLAEEWEPAAPVLLVIPCSNIKPYTRGPTARRVRNLLRRLGLQSRVELLFFSDLLGLVPYGRAEEYPACCYDVPPSVVVGDSELEERVRQPVRRALERVSDRLEAVILYLPRRHLYLINPAIPESLRRVTHTVKYSIYNTRELGENLLRIAGTGKTLDRWLT